MESKTESQAGSTPMEQTSDSGFESLMETNRPNSAMEAGAPALMDAVQPVASTSSAQQPELPFLDRPRDLIPVMLSVEEEFYLIAGVVLNNWFAVQVGIAESDRSAAARELQIQNVFWTAYNSILSYKSGQCSWDDSVEFLESALHGDMNVIIEDGSADAVMADLAHFFNLVEDCATVDIIWSMKRFRNHYHILNREEISFNDLRVIRIPHYEKFQATYKANPEPSVHPVYLRILRANHQRQVEHVNENAPAQGVICISSDEDEDEQRDAAVLPLNNEDVINLSSDLEEDGNPEVEVEETAVTEDDSEMLESKENNNESPMEEEKENAPKKDNGDKEEGPDIKKGAKKKGGKKKKDTDGMDSNDDWKVVTYKKPKRS